MAHDSKNDTGIKIAIITVVGAIVAAIITVSGNYNVEKMRQDVELTKIALSIQSTQMVLQIVASPPTETFLPTMTVTSIVVPQANLTSQVVNSNTSANLYVLGYTSSDLAVVQASSNCTDCKIIFLSSLNELPDDWNHHSFNLASPTANLSDGCRTKQELINLGVTLMIANNYTPCQPKAIASPVVTNCPSPSSYAINVQTLIPGMIISGPATIHPYDGSAELAQALGLIWVARWGINIPTGTTVQIPQSVTLLSGKQYIPQGYIDIYLDNARMEAAQQCWLINN